jgi:hypothetical protein
MIEIWQPRWKDRMVLIAKHKVRKENAIVFTKTKSLKDKVFFIDRDEIRDFPLGTNGKIDCYEVPLDVILEKELGNNAEPIIYRNEDEDR